MDKVQMTCFQFPSLLNLLLRTLGLSRAFKHNRFFGRGDMRWWNRDSEREVDVVSGMFMLVRSDAVRAVGMMDEDYFMYYEETDWCYRFARQGWKMLFWPGAMIIHPDGGGHSSGTQSVRLRVQMQKSMLIFFRKHYGTLHCLLARLLLSAYTGLRCVALTLPTLAKRLRGMRRSSEAMELRQRWLIFKYCLLGIEPKHTN
jgi:GT2 family glycosyltransferase